MPDGNAIVAGLVGAIGALAGFASWLIKKYMEDMAKNYEARLAEQSKQYEAQLKSKDDLFDRLAEAQKTDAETARDSINILTRLEVLLQDRVRGGRS